MGACREDSARIPFRIMRALVYVLFIASLLVAHSSCDDDDWKHDGFDPLDAGVDTRTATK